MINLFKDLRWELLKIDFTKLLGRLYYFIGALIWWVIDILIFVVFGVKITTLIIVIPLGIITIKKTIEFIGTLMYATLCKSTKSKLAETFDRANALQGVPGAGKTSSINQIGYLFACQQWKQLQHEYWKICYTPFNLLPKRLKDKYIEVIKAYNFYKKHEDKYIPCLHSFIIVKVNDRKSHSLTKAHLLQQKPLPYRSVWVCDEISSIFPNSLKGEVKNTNANLSELCRWIRHFTDSYAFFADIRFGNAFLAIRASCGCVMTLTKKQKWVLKPTFLIGLRNIIYSFIDYNFWLQRLTKKGSASFNKASYNVLKSSKRFGRFISWLDKLIACVGYRKYTYVRQGGTEQAKEADAVETTKGHYYFKSCLDVQYNERAFRNLYKCKDMDFLEPENSDLQMSEQELKKMLGLTA